MPISTLAKDLTHSFEKHKTDLAWRRRQLEAILKALKENEASVWLHMPFFLVISEELSIISPPHIG